MTEGDKMRRIDVFTATFKCASGATVHAFKTSLPVTGLRSSVAQVNLQ